MLKREHSNEEPIDVSSDKVEPKTLRENSEQGKVTEEEPETTKAVNIEGEEEEQNETTPTPVPQKDNAKSIPPSPIESMSEQDHEINLIIDKVIESDK
ncbi:hypothetical protein PVK06_024299 [Gossypium arboreum]|uniref:Uncharacterized protein n=1 Tax=Gossypium arboreum TaxID=29729 RepID=A0ABR0PDM0_GOSAR|nr:hypothetical protein PVK06_024299 [Gossypium arboreum]